MPLFASLCDFRLNQNSRSSTKFYYLTKSAKEHQIKGIWRQLKNLKRKIREVSPAFGRTTRIPLAIPFDCVFAALHYYICCLLFLAMIEAESNQNCSSTAALWTLKATRVVSCLNCQLWSNFFCRIKLINLENCLYVSYVARVAFCIFIIGIIFFVRLEFKKYFVNWGTDEKTEKWIRY